MQTLEFKSNGQTIKWEEKSHAQIFRNFWAHFIAEDLEKTIETIELAGIRTDNKPEFVAKNGSRKKHVHIDGNLWVYSHLTPKAMQKTYDKFLAFYEHEQQETQPDAPVDVVADEETKPVEVVEEQKLSPQQKAARTRKRNKEKKEAEKRAKELAEAQAQAQANVNTLSEEEIENVEL